MNSLRLLSLTLICAFLLRADVGKAQAELKPSISKTNIALYNYDLDVMDFDINSFYNITDEMRDSYYKMIWDSLLAVNGIKIKPKGFLAGKIKYNMYGWPASKGKKVVETNKADSYISIGVRLEGTGIRKQPNERNPNDCVLTLQVQVNLSITVFDKSGNMVFDETTTAKSPDKIEFHYSKSNLTDKITTKKIVPADPQVMLELTKLALVDMTHNKLPK